MRLITPVWTVGLSSNNQAAFILQRSGMNGLNLLTKNAKANVREADWTMNQSLFGAINVHTTHFVATWK